MEVAHRGGQSTEGGDSVPLGAVSTLVYCVIWAGVQFRAHLGLLSSAS
jgi:hypothetical protein